MSLSDTKDELSFELFEKKTQTILTNFYTYTRPEKNEDDFIADILMPMLNDESTSGRKCIELINSALVADKSSSLKYGAMLVSCAYCVEARRELACDRERAWWFMAEAAYWSGVVWASEGTEEAREKTITATKKSTGKNANDVRNKPYLKMQEEAFRLIRENVQKGIPWTTSRKAALKITPAVQAIALTLGKRLEPTAAQTTITGWLKKMPEAASIFPEDKVIKK